MKEDKPLYYGHRERAQEKFLSTQNPESIPDYEFLELLLMKSIPRLDVKPLAKELLKHFGSLSNVLNAPFDELSQFKNIKKSTFVLFKLILEANKRLFKEDLKQRPVLLSRDNLVDYCCLCTGDTTQERLIALYLDLKGHLIRTETLQTGPLDQVAIYPREILKQTLMIGAKSLVLVHNHPTGDPQPSSEDYAVTVELYYMLKTVDIDLIDHLIIGTGRRIFSFREHGHLTVMPRR